ncbi:MAG: sel1 repeat family protein, partial [Desulfovibrio sp.]|nr:sel1 repeat family protein [Desulfovibrio sp.]
MNFILPIYKFSLPPHPVIPPSIDATFVKKKAKKGIPEYQFLLSRLYENGIGVNHDEDKRIFWAQKAANQNYLPAMVLIGTFALINEGPYFNYTDNCLIQKAYEAGSIDACTNIGIFFCNKKEKKGVEYLKKAVKEENSRAQLALGTMLICGYLVNKNLKKGIELLKQSDLQGIGEAAYVLSYIYHSDEFGVKDPVKAYTCALRCCQRRSNRFPEHIIKYYQEGIVVDKNIYNASEIINADHRINSMNAEIISEYQDLLNEQEKIDREFIRKNKNSAKTKPELQYKIGKIYLSLNKTDKDLSLGRQYLTAASNANLIEAQFALAESFISTDEINKAMSLYKLLAKQGYAEAQFEYGYCLRKKQETQKAFQWFKMAADQNYGEAHALLGVIYLRGESNVACDYKKALDHCQKAITYGGKNAQHWMGPTYYNLGAIYERGLGVDVDIDRAVEFYKQSHEYNHMQGLFSLIQLYEHGYTKNGLSKAFNALYALERYGDPSASSRLAKYYLDGKLFPRDPYGALGCYEWAISYKDFYLESAIGLAELIISGLIPWFQPQESLRYITFAKCGHDHRLLFLLGLMLDYGYILNQSAQQAHKVYSLAGLIGSTKAFVNMSMHYLLGEIGEVDKKKAFELAEKAVADNNAIAQTNLGLMYKYGIGTEKNKESARKWLSLAKKQDDPVAAAEIQSISTNSNTLLIEDIPFRKISKQDYLDFQALVDGTYVPPNEDEEFDIEDLDISHKNIMIVRQDPLDYDFDDDDTEYVLYSWPVYFSYD